MITTLNIEIRKIEVFFFSEHKSYLLKVFLNFFFLDVMENICVFYFSEEGNVGKKMNRYNCKNMVNISNNKTGKSFKIFVPGCGKFVIFLTGKFSYMCAIGSMGSEK